MSRDNLPANPLQALIDGVAKTTPADTGTVENFRNRLLAWGPVLVLLDCSASMAERAGGRTKAEVLRDALRDLAPELGSAYLIAFSATARKIGSADEIPPPSGSTALDRAIDRAAEFMPSRTLIFTDGHPDDARAALASAENLQGRIDGVFCGPDSDAAGLAFLQKLARVGCGSAVRCDVARSVAPVAELASAARKVLSLEMRR